MDEKQRGHKIPLKKNPFLAPILCTRFVLWEQKEGWLNYVNSKAQNNTGWNRMKIIEHESYSDFIATHTWCTAFEE